MKFIRVVKEALGTVFGKKTYVFLAITFALFIYAANPLLQNIQILIEEFTPRLAFSLILGTPSTMTLFSYILLLLIAILGGIVFSFGVYQLRKQVSLEAGAGISSIFVSLLAPACPSCALGLLGVIGLGGFLTILPFRGLELGLLGIIILLVSLVYLSQKITATTCAIKPQKKV